MIKNSEYWGPTPVPGDLSADNGARNRKETWQECAIRAKSTQRSVTRGDTTQGIKIVGWRRTKTATANVWERRCDSVHERDVTSEPVKYDPKDSGSPPTCITTMIAVAMART